MNMISNDGQSALHGLSADIQQVVLFLAGSSAKADKA
jgi:hypothetical protein